MTPASTTCPRCRRTIWKGAACDCPPREPQAPPRPGSSLATGIKLAVWLLAIAVGVGWVVWLAVRGR